MIASSARMLLVVAEEEQFDPDSVTPGVWGFVLTFLVMVAVVLLVLDMVRRIRRVNYRAEVRAQLEAEQLEEQYAAEGGDAVPDAPSTKPAASDDDTPPTR